jgi:hypothetical protein
VNDIITFIRVKITYTRASRNHTRECHIHTYVSKLLSCEWKPHSACGNRTLRVEINLVRVEVTLVRVKITLCV